MRVFDRPEMLVEDGNSISSISLVRSDHDAGDTADYDLEALSWQGWQEPLDAEAELEDHYYLRIYMDDVTWSEAQELAGLFGGYLATIGSEEENDLVHGMATADSSFGGPIFIGASDAAVEGSWTWHQPGGDELFWTGAADGTPEGGAYTNWNVDEPDNFDGDQHFLEMRDDGTWNDLSADVTLGGFVVEFDARPDGFRLLYNDNTGFGRAFLRYDDSGADDRVIFWLNKDGVIAAGDQGSTGQITIPVIDGQGVGANTQVQFAIQGTNDDPEIDHGAGFLGFELGLLGVITQGMVQSMADAGNGTDHAARLITSPDGTLHGNTLDIVAQSLLVDQGEFPVEFVRAPIMWTDVYLAAGQTLEFEWRFTTEEQGFEGFNDFAFFTVASLSGQQFVGEYHELANVYDGLLVGSWEDASFEAPQSGLYRIGYGVANAGQDRTTSTLAIDNIRGFDIGAMPNQLIGVEVQERIPGFFYYVDDQLVGSGTFTFYDPDASNPTVRVEVIGDLNYVGAITPEIEDLGGGNWKVDWQFSAHITELLGLLEIDPDLASRQQTYTLVVADEEGSEAEQPIELNFPVAGAQYQPTTVWTDGDEDGDWDNSQNWTHGVPTSSDVALIGSPNYAFDVTFAGNETDDGADVQLRGLTVGVATLALSSASAGAHDIFQTGFVKNANTGVIDVNVMELMVNSFVLNDGLGFIENDGLIWARNGGIIEVDYDWNNFIIGGVVATADGQVFSYGRMLGGTVWATDGGYVYAANTARNEYDRSTTYVLQGGTIELDGTVDGSEVYFHSDYSDTLILDRPDQFSGTLLSFGSGDVIGFGDSGSGEVSIVSYDAGAGELVLDLDTELVTLSFWGGESYSLNNFAVREQDGALQLAYQDTNHLGLTELIATDATGRMYGAAFSPDDTKLAFWHEDPFGQSFIYVVSPDVWPGAEYYSVQLGVGETEHAAPSALSFSHDGSLVAFASDDPALGATDGFNQIFLADTSGGQPLQMIAIGEGEAARMPVFSPTETKVAFWLQDANLNDGWWDLVVEDYETQQRILFDVNSASAGTLPAFSSDGERILAGVDDGSGVHYLHEFDLTDTNVTAVQAYSTAFGGSVQIPVGAAAYAPGSGRIAFASDYDFAGVDGGWTYYVLEQDLSVTLVATGASPNNGSIAFLDDHRVVFAGNDDLVVPEDENGTMDIYIKDLNTGTFTLVSSAPSGDAASFPVGPTGSFGPAVSHDGTVVAFDLWASDLVGQPDTTNHDSIFLRQVTPVSVEVYDDGYDFSLLYDHMAAADPISAGEYELDHFLAVGNDYSFTVMGHDLTYIVDDDTFEITGGIITAVEIYGGSSTDGDQVAAVQGLHMFAPAFGEAVAAYAEFSDESQLDALFGTVAYDALGGAVEDTLVGGQAGDALHGRGGDDTLVGNGGNDVLTGGASADNFVFKDTFGNDTITDFTPGVDLLTFDTSIYANAQALLDAITDPAGAGTVVIPHGSDSVMLTSVTNKNQLSVSDFHVA